MQSILVTGAAGFIGFHLAKRLCTDGYRVFGLDNLNDYYDPSLKEARLAQLEAFGSFTFAKADLADAATISRLFAEWRPDIVINLAAQAGVRYSLENPRAYVTSNVDGFINVLEGCRETNVKHLIFASSSSVYGANDKQPFSVQDSVDHPISLYAATKKANELMAHSYAHLFNLPCTGLRFFTVYGPWGRPDMALFKFVKAMYAGEALDIYNRGEISRDFTYIDDIVEGIVRLIGRTPQPDPDFKDYATEPGRSHAPYRIYNIGNNQPEKLMEMIRLLEAETGITAKLNLLPAQPGDMLSTYADITDLTNDIGFTPATPLDKGIAQFVKWYREYYRMGNKPDA